MMLKKDTKVVFIDWRDGQSRVGTVVYDQRTTSVVIRPESEQDPIIVHENRIEVTKWS